MKTTGLFIFAAASAMTLAGCSDERPVGTGGTNPAEVRFTAGIEGSATATRTTNGGDDWTTGDGVGIYMLSGGGAIPAGILSGAANVHYSVANATTGSLLPSVNAVPIEYPANGMVDFAAYYPYSDANVDADGLYSVALTNQGNPAAVDVLTARSASHDAAVGGEVNFTFAHALSKVTLHVRAGTDVAPADVAAIASVRLSGTPGSVKIDVDGGAVTDGPNAVIGLVKAAAAATGYDATFSAIVAPGGGLGRRLTLVFDGNSIEWAVPDDAFTPGHNRVYWGEITDSGVRVAASDITDWDNDPPAPVGSALGAKLQGNNRVTWDGANSRYVLTTDPTDAGLFFRFGSVAGIFSGNGANTVLPTAAYTDPFDPADVAWSPVEITGTEATGWATVPMYDGTTDYPAPIDAAYHTAANVKLGKGDPCRLVGLDLAYIAATDAGTLTAADIDNGKWRLPTVAEQQAFSGQTANVAYNDHWTTLDGSGVIGGMFPNATLGDDDTFLPATGYRSTTPGGLTGVGTGGHYWSSTPYDNTAGSYLRFDSGTVTPVPSAGTYEYAITVRCVRQ